MVIQLKKTYRSAKEIQGWATKIVPEIRDKIAAMDLPMLIGRRKKREDYTFLNQFNNVDFEQLFSTKNN